MEKINLSMKVLSVTFTIVGIVIVTFLAFESCGVVPRWFFRKKWQKKLEDLFERYVKTLDPPRDGEYFENVRISSIGYLEADVCRDILGEKVVVRKNATIEKSDSTKYEDSLLEILDKILEETGCRTAEELEMWLEKGGY